MLSRLNVICFLAFDPVTTFKSCFFLEKRLYFAIYICEVAKDIALPNSISH